MKSEDILFYGVLILIMAFCIFVFTPMFIELIKCGYGAWVDAINMPWGE